MAKLTAFTKNTSGLNSGVEQLPIIKVPIESVRTHPTFQNLLPINPSDLEEITKNMQENGFEKNKAVCIWKEEGILIDGYTRLSAARAAGLSDIYKYEKSFDSETAALQYAVEQQLNRRNLNDAGKILLIEKLDSLRKAGRPDSETAERTEKGKSAEALGKALGISTRSVERVRSVLKNADEELLNKVKSGEVSINHASSEIQRQKKEKIQNTPPETSAEFPPMEDEPEQEATEYFPEIDFEDFEPLEERISLYEEIMQMDLHHLALFLHESQGETLTVADWEERLGRKE